MDITITTAEIRAAWMDIQDGKNPTKQSAIASAMSGWKGPLHNSFIGCSGEEMCDWLLNGYNPEGTIQVNASGAEDISTPTVVTDEEEGELCLDMLLAGEDEFRVRYEDVPAPQGITIKAQINMLAVTPADVLSEYQDFVLRAVDAAKTLGGAPALTISHRANSVFLEDGSILNLEIPLVKQGEEIDPTAWRAFLAKGSFRSLGFLARGIAADKQGMTLSSGFGASCGLGWNVRREDDTIYITCPASAMSFPREDMERMLHEVL